MLLRADVICEQPSFRFVIRNLKNDMMWDGESFVDDFDQARKYCIRQTHVPICKTF